MQACVFFGGRTAALFLEDAVHGEHLRVPDVRSLAAAAHEAHASLVLDISSPDFIWL